MTWRSTHADPASRRLSGGFTLDEAARLHESGFVGTAARCPGCGGPMRAVSGSRPSGGVSLVRCQTCGRGLVFDGPGDEVFG